MELSKLDTRGVYILCTKDDSVAFEGPFESSARARGWIHEHGSDDVDYITAKVHKKFRRHSLEIVRVKELENDK